MAIELVKVSKNTPIEHYKNAFLNLALPLFVFSEPASAVKTRMRLCLSGVYHGLENVTGVYY